nr:hypothetical protein [Tanacetum cinerariifolium]
MLATGNYVQWKSKIKRYIDTKPNYELIHYCLQNPPYKYKWADKDVPVTEGCSETTKRYMENYKNVSLDIHDQLNAEAESVQIILTEIDNDIYSTVDACPNVCKMWKAIERLKQGELINVQDLETNLYWEFGKFTSRDGESLESYYSMFYKMMNELVRNQCDVTNHQVNVQFLLQLQLEWKRFITLVKQSQELKTVSYHKLYDILKQHQNEVNEIRAERLARTANPLAFVAQQQPVYHPQNHPTHYTQNSSNISQQVTTRNRGKAIVNSPPPIYDQEPSVVAEDDEIANQDNSPRINRGTGYDNQRIVNVARARETVGTTVADQDDDDDHSNERDLLASLIEKLKCEVDDNKKRNKYLETSNKALVEKLKDLKKFQAELDRHNDVKYASKVKIDYAKAKWDLISYKMESKKSFNKYTQKINDLNQTISEIKKELSAHQETISILSQAKEAQIKFYKTREDKEIDKVIALENKVKVLDNIVYKTSQSVQTMNMRNRNCKTSFTKPEFLKKAQRANPRLYDIGFYNDNLALMLAHKSDEVIRLEKESRSKLSDLIRSFDYEKLNNLYDLFVPQCEKSSAQSYFSERGVAIIFDGVERYKQTIAKRTYFSHIDPFIQNTIEGNFCLEIQRINADLEKFHLCLKEKMVVDLRYFNSLELEVDSLRSQLETQKTQFLNEIDRLSREYYYVDHMNAILGVYTELDKVTNLQCDYLETLDKCECLEKELSKSKVMSNSFEALQKYAINLELELQQCQE